MASRYAWPFSPRSFATYRREGSFDRPMTTGNPAWQGKEDREGTFSASIQTKRHRDTLFVEDAEVLAHERFEANQCILKLHAQQCAAAATPGSFVHLSCDASLPMRRPLSIMRADASRGSIEVLYKVVGGGLDLLAKKRAGDRVSSL